MKHIDDDTLYKYTLELFDKTDSKRVCEHLRKCEICKNKLQKIEDEIELISSYNPNVELKMPSLPAKNSIGLVWLKRAAVLIVGIFIGYSSSNLLQKDQILVVGQTFIPQNSLIDSTQFVDCPTIDIYMQN